MNSIQIVSGGQTGVDRAALDAAMHMGFPCGGWCPANRLAEDGPISMRYPLRELPLGGYIERTKCNVEDSDATLIVYFSCVEGGTAYTLQLCRALGKPWLLINAETTNLPHSVEQINEFVLRHAVRRLNVAGPRASKQPHLYRFSFDVLCGFLQRWRDGAGTMA